jgi:hypothetical protein
LGTSGPGEVFLDPGLLFEDVSAVAVIDRPGQADDGKIVVAGGWTNPAANFREGVAVARLNPDGSLDTTFGGGGVVLDSRTTFGASALVVQPGETE